MGRRFTDLELMTDRQKAAYPSWKAIFLLNPAFACELLDGNNDVLWLRKQYLKMVKADMKKLDNAPQTH